MAQDIKKAIDILANPDLQGTVYPAREAVAAAAAVALDELVTLARAYTMVAYIEKVNGYKFA
jgi:hypothetical protein